MRFAPGAWRFALPALVLAVPAIFVSTAASAVLLAIGGFVLWFFRDPERRPPPTGIVAPADGRVTVIREEPAEPGDERRVRVGVFMGVQDVHVNRAPLAGTVESVEHSSGRHMPAFTKESDRNERVRIDLGDATVVLIAGAFARRITTYVEPGDTVERGDRIGHIAFGSRADIILPADIPEEAVRVAYGERVRAGESIIARAP